MTAHPRLAEAPLLPPVFDAAICAAGRAFDHALADAAAGAGAGRLRWRGTPDALEIAVVLEPDMALRRAIRARVAVRLAMADALAAVAPPHKPVTLHGSAGLAVDGAAIGGVSLAWPPGARGDAVPDWLVAGVRVRRTMDGEAGEPGEAPDRTALMEEGFDAVSDADLVERFARHLLHWMSRWEEEGFAPLARHRAARRTTRLPAGAEAA
ncbi:biotin/lipoate--protein ligase family protein [Azospirillum halopraeferens]|uniref:biotin/lipoate--protein ligase family protein n=1 Tax=Azospirillum halopraeferens TaxID=34010 RepID=UPI00041D6E0F|nr:biotin/lipoate--protein ligase family protein [Azospirillum halopraeferens]